MPDATRKAVQEMALRREASIQNAFRLLAKPLVRDAAGAERLADVIHRVGRGEVDIADVGDELKEIYRDIPD